jgi:Tol biopolymer transport system component
MTENSSRQNETALESWKEIAAYLKRDVRTVKRWEKTEALPVRRHLHQARSSVYAYPSELETWKSARQPGFDKAPLVMPWRRPLPALGFAVTLLLALISVASGPILTPPGAAAQESGGIVARQVWAGPGVDILGGPSPDGRYLTFVDWETGDLAVRDLKTGENRRLTNKGSWFESREFAEYPRISPSGKQVAYAWFNKDNFYELRIIGLDGSKPRVLYRNEEVPFAGPAAWSPDGKHVLAKFFSSKDRIEQIVLVSVSDGSVRVLKALGWRWGSKTSFSPDGRYIVYDFPPREDSANRDIFLLATDGSRETPLVEHPANDFVLGWAPDGKSVVFVSDRTGSTGAWIIQVADGKPQGSPELVKPDMGRIRPMGFTADGSYYYGLYTGMNDVYTATLDLTTGKLLAPPTKASQRFEGSNYGADWSPDGKYLAYISLRGISPFARGQGSRIISIRSVKTGEERELLPELSLLSVGIPSRIHLPWSPDGRSFVVSGHDKKGRQGIYQIDAQTGDVTLIVQSEPRRTWVGILAWSPDGEAIYYKRTDVTRKSSRILVRALVTGREKELYRAVAPSGVGSLGVSPDGRQLAFTLKDSAKRSTALMLMPTAGGEARELLKLQEPESIPDVGGLTWTPDGREVIFAKDSLQEQTTELWRISAEGGEPQKLGLAMKGLRNLRFHPDGRRIAFSAGTPFSAEVWVMENFLPKTEAQAARLEDE